MFKFVVYHLSNVLCLVVIPITFFQMGINLLTVNYWVDFILIYLNNRKYDSEVFFKNSNNRCLNINKAPPHKKKYLVLVASIITFTSVQHTFGTSKLAPRNLTTNILKQPPRCHKYDRYSLELWRIGRQKTSIYRPQTFQTNGRHTSSVRSRRLKLPPATQSTVSLTATDRST